MRLHPREQHVAGPGEAFRQCADAVRGFSAAWRRWEELRNPPLPKPSWRTWRSDTEEPPHA